MRRFLFLGVVLAFVLNEAPEWAPTLILPGVLVFLLKTAVDRADRRSRDLELTSAVGRAVAGTLKAEVAFRAITSREVRDVLRLDGMALMPLAERNSYATEPPPKACSFTVNWCG